MNIRYIEPVQYSWRWAREELFHPFDLGKWLVLGFAAWLAYLFHGGGGNYEGEVGLHPETGGLRHVGRAAGHAFSSMIERFVAHPVAGTFILMGLLIAVAFLAALLWLSSRAKFIFLDDVVRNRAAIVEPWRRLGELGDSLFLWRLGFGAFSLLMAAMLASLFIGGAVMFAAGGMLNFFEIVLMAAGTVLTVLAGLALVFVAMWTEHFVVPIMYRFELGVLEAWRYFLPWLKTYPVQFGLFVLWVFVLGVGVMAAIGVVGLLTCCIGFAVLLLPYVGTVVLLPVWVTYRMLGPAFLSQFDPAFSLAETDDEGIEQPAAG